MMVLKVCSWLGVATPCNPEGQDAMSGLGTSFYLLRLNLEATIGLKERAKALLPKGPCRTQGT